MNEVPKKIQMRMIEGPDGQQFLQPLGHPGNGQSHLPVPVANGNGNAGLPAFQNGQLVEVEIVNAVVSATKEMSIAWGNIVRDMTLDGAGFFYRETVTMEE